MTLTGRYDHGIQPPLRAWNICTEDLYGPSEGVLSTLSEESEEDK